MQHTRKIILLALSAGLLTACGSTKVAISDSHSIGTIRHVCIAAKERYERIDFNNKLADAFQKQKITATLLQRGDKVQGKSCDAVLKYKLRGNRVFVGKGTFILRTTGGASSVLEYKGRDSTIERSNPDMQAQADEIVGLLLGKLQPQVKSDANQTSTKK